MGTDAEKWSKEEGEKVLKEVGIKENHIILDFGCGAGTYSLPAAKIVGKKGQVFALDKSKSKLRTRKPKLRSVFKNQSSNSYLRERKNIQKLLKGG